MMLDTGDQITSISGDRLSPVASEPLRKPGLHPVFNASIGFLILFGLWWLVSLATPSYLLPSPPEVAAALSHLAADGSLGADLFATSATTLAGLSLAVAAALFLAVGFVLFPRLAATAYPTVIALRSIPAVAAAPLLVIWTGTGEWTRILIAALVAFFPVLVYGLHGLRSPSQDYVDQFAIWAASRRQVLLHLRLPWSLSSFFASLKVATAYALIGSFVAEMIGSNRGLGQLVVTAYYHFETPVVLAGIVLFAALGLTLFGATVWLERLVSRRMMMTTAEN